MNGQTRAVGFGERDLVVELQLAPQQAAEHFWQSISGHQKTSRQTAAGQGQAHLHDLHAQAVGHGYEVAARVGRTAQAACRGAGLTDLGERHVASHALKHGRAKRRVGVRQQPLCIVAPLQPNQLTVLTQQGGCLGTPEVGRGFIEMQGLQALHIAHQAVVQVTDGFVHVTLQPVLHLTGFIQTGQPNQHGQQGHHQQHQNAPQRTPAPRRRYPTAPALAQFWPSTLVPVFSLLSGLSLAADAFRSTLAIFGSTQLPSI